MEGGREHARGRVSWQASWGRWQEGQMACKATEVGAYNRYNRYEGTFSGLEDWRGARVAQQG